MVKRRPVLFTMGLDPGLTTGYAVLDHRGGIWECGNLRPEDLRDGLDGLIREVNRMGEELEVCQEILAKGRMGELSNALRFVERAIERIVVETYGVSVIRVLPGTWKTHRSVLTIPYPETWDGMPLTPHQRDAIGLARYRMANRSPNYLPRPRHVVDDDEEEFPDDDDPTVDGDRQAREDPQRPVGAEGPRPGSREWTLRRVRYAGLGHGPLGGDPRGLRRGWVGS